MRKIYLALFALAGIWVLLSLASCKKEHQVEYPIPSNLQLISSGYAQGASIRVEIYASNNLFVGYNRLYIALYDSVSNNRITQSQISLSASMKAGNGILQAGPVENPAGQNADNGLFNAAAVFVSPSTGAGVWMLAVQISNTAGNATGIFSSTVNIIQPSPAKAYTVSMQGDSTSMFVALVQPSNPQPGANSFEMAIYHQVNAACFAPDSSYMISLYATMPFMTGMNAPDNVNPVYTANGHYQGKVDFIMTGTWQIYITLTHNSEVADSSHYFAINL